MISWRERRGKIDHPGGPTRKRMLRPLLRERGKLREKIVTEKRQPRGGKPGYSPAITKEARFGVLEMRWLQFFSVEDSVHCHADDPDGKVG